MPDLRLRFVAYEPGATSGRTLPYPLGASIADEMNDLGQGSLDYSEGAQHAASIEGLCEIGVEAAAADGSWTEFGARMLRLKRGGSRIDETRTRRYSLFSYGFQLGKIRMLREETLNDEGERLFPAAAPGVVLKTLIDEAKARGNVTHLTYSFTATHDSAGVPWAGSLAPLTVRFGEDLLSMLRTLADNGHVDWRIVGRDLKVYNADGLGVTRPVVLHNSRDLIEAPDDEDATDMAGRIGVQGDDGRTYEAVSPSAGPWGLWEESISAAGVKDIGALQYIGELEQSRRAAPRVQMTRGLRVVGVAYLPHVHYGVGDTITAPDDSGASAPLRVRQITLGIDRYGATGNLVLNDRFLEKDVRARRSVAGLLGGAAASAGGAGLPSPAGDERREPAAPTGLTVSSVHLYTPVGDPFAVIDAAFTPVTLDTTGAAIMIDRHEMYARINVSGEPWRKLTDTPGARITYSPLPAGEAWQFKVRAVSRQGVQGAFGDPVTVTLAADTTPPPEPAALTGASRLGQMVLQWTGRDALGALQPVDFSHAIVWMGTAPIGPGVAVGRMGGRETFVAPMQPYGEERWFWLTAVDTSGNESDPSDRVSLTTQSLVDADLIGIEIDGANIEDGTIVASDKIVANSITAAEIAALTVTADELAANAVTADKIDAGAVTAEKIDAGAVEADNIAAGAVTAGKIAADAVTAEKLAADAITGKTITGGTINGAQITAEDGLTVAEGGSLNFPFTSGGTTWSNRLKPSSEFAGLEFERRVTAQAFIAMTTFSQIRMSTATGTANVRIVDAAGNLRSVSSMRQLKLDREEIGPEYGLLDLPGRTWRDREMVEADPDEERRIAGFVAEDLATLTAFNGGAFDAILEYDDDGRATGIAYDRVVAFLLPIIRDMDARLRAVEA